MRNLKLRSRTVYYAMSPSVVFKPYSNHEGLSIIIILLHFEATKRAVFWQKPTAPELPFALGAADVPLVSLAAVAAVTKAANRGRNKATHARHWCMGCTARWWDQRDVARARWRAEQREWWIRYNAAPSEPGTEDEDDEHQDAGQTYEDWAEMDAEREGEVEPST